MRNRPIPTLSEEDKAFARSLVIHEDEVLLAFNKPPGLSVQTRGNRGRNLDHLLWAFARSNGKRPRLIHRIDTGTSGLIIAAKTKPMAVFLSEAFASRNVEKTYLTLVSGDLPAKDRGMIDVPLRPLETRPPRTKVAEDGQPARTVWTILGRNAPYALIEAKPQSGRMHQIRAHLTHLGCPILGDHIYGEASSAPRLMLHAAGLNLPMPDGTGLELTAPLPADFTTCQASLGL